MGIFDRLKPQAPEPSAAAGGAGGAGGPAAGNAGSGAFRDSGDKYAGAGGGGDKYAQYGAPPALPMYGGGGAGTVGIDAVSPMLGIPGMAGGAAAGGGQHQPEYLEYNSRDWTSRMFLNTGGVYLFGIATAGLYGAGEGWRKAAGMKGKIRLNSLLNHSAMRGSRLGNALGVLAVIFSGVEALADKYHVADLVGGHEWASPISAAVATGALYRCTHGPKAMALAGLTGGVFVGVMATAGRQVTSRLRFISKSGILPF